MKQSSRLTDVNLHVARHASYECKLSTPQPTGRVFTRPVFFMGRVALNQFCAARTTAWTLPRILCTLRSMTTKRSKYDPLACSIRPRWLVLRDLFHNVLDSTELAPGTDLRRAFADGLAALERQGWQSEGASGGMVFVRRGGERRLLAVHEHDPQEPVPAGHGAPAGRCLTCEQ